MGLKYLLLFFSLILFSGNSCQREKAVNVDQQIELAKTEIAFDHSGAFPINLDLFGQSTSHMFQVIDQVNEDVVSAIEKVSPQFLRFPGGTGSNYYHFFENGYGFNEADAEMSKGHAPYPKMLKRIGIEKKRIDHGKAEDNYSKKCVELALNLKVPVVLVANIFSGSDEENLAMVSYFIGQNVEVKGIELGNEYYFKAYTSQFPDCGEYIKRCKIFVSKLKSIYPKIPVAVTAANPPMGTGYALKNRFQDWNNSLAAEEFYDAYIVHFYSKTPDCDGKKEIRDRFECANLENLNIQKKWISTGLDYYEGLFGSNKEIWLTEFNVKNVFKNYGNTATQALYNADFLLNLIRNGKVDLAIYHNLLTSSYGFAMINKTKNGLRDRVATKTFKLFSHLNENFYVLPNAKVFESDEHIEQLLFYSEKERKYLCYIVNHKGNGIAIKLPTMEMGQMSLKGFYADQLYSGIGHNAFESSEDVSGIHDLNIDISGLSTELKPYSFSMIEVILP